METTLATILITVIGTLTVIGLGVIIWAIAQLNRRVSTLEGLGVSEELKNRRDIDSIYLEFELLRREHDDVFKDFTNSHSKDRDECFRRIDETNRELDQKTERTHHRIDDVTRELNERIERVHHRISEENSNLERNLDKRFDSVYRKFYSNKANSDLVGGLESNN